MKPYIVLIRREFWEHRVLWMAPLVLASLFMLICLIPGVSFNGLDAGRPSLSAATAGPLVFASIQMISTMLLFGLMSVVAFFYLSDCLFAERKDRSILFWKSLPVSDAATVLSKLLVALLVLPLGVYLLAVVSNLAAFVILYARFHGTAAVRDYLQWDTGVWLRLNFYLVIDVLVLALWFAPVAAYQLLISGWAKSSVFLWTVLPPLVLIVGEKFAFNTWNVARVLGYRLGSGLSSTTAPGLASAGTYTGSMNLEGVYDRVNLLPLMATPDLWIGVAVAAALIFLTIRIRRFRDDT